MDKNIKNILKDTIEGYEKASSISVTERKNRLRQLSREESFREFMDMWNLYHLFEKRQPEKLDKIRIHQIILRRHFLDKQNERYPS